MKGNGTNGVWILTRIDNSADREYYKCSRCKKHYVKLSIQHRLYFPEFNSVSDYPFCHCGAKMKAESDRVIARKRREAGKAVNGILNFACEEVDK